MSNKILLLLGCLSSLFAPVEIGFFAGLAGREACESRVVPDDILPGFVEQIQQIFENKQTINLRSLVKKVAESPDLTTYLAEYIAAVSDYKSAKVVNPFFESTEITTNSRFNFNILKNASAMVHSMLIIPRHWPTDASIEFEINLPQSGLCKILLTTSCESVGLAREKINFDDPEDLLNPNLLTYILGIYRDCLFRTNIYFETLDIITPIKSYKFSGHTEDNHFSLNPDNLLQIAEEIDNLIQTSIDTGALKRLEILSNPYSIKPNIVAQYVTRQDVEIMIQNLSSICRRTGIESERAKLKMLKSEQYSFSAEFCPPTYSLLEDNTAEVKLGTWDTIESPDSSSRTVMSLIIFDKVFGDVTLCYPPLKRIGELIPALRQSTFPRFRNRDLSPFNDGKPIKAMELSKFVEYFAYHCPRLSEDAEKTGEVEFSLSTQSLVGRKVKTYQDLCKFEFIFRIGDVEHNTKTLEDMQNASTKPWVTIRA